MSSLEVLAEEVTFGVWVCVLLPTQAVSIPYDTQPTEATQYFYYQPKFIKFQFLDL